MAVLKDSGERRVFETGANRDVSTGKGRCDLLPLDTIAKFVPDPVIQELAKYQLGQTMTPREAFIAFVRREYGGYTPDALLEVAKQFEDGAVKYGDDNWQKGIPTSVYMDSAIRHYLKFLLDWTDEPHDRAFMWNVLCAMWTVDHHPELNDYPKNNETKTI